MESRAYSVVDGQSGHVRKRGHGLRAPVQWGRHMRTIVTYQALDRAPERSLTGRGPTQWRGQSESSPG